jgi:YXWGXW repeat-containing protein
MTKKIALLLASGLMLAATTLPAAAAHVDVQIGLPAVVIGTPPPAPIVEVAPGPRAGYVWAPGYWAWHDGRHVWIHGRWIAENPGYLWIGEHWENRGGQHYFVAGRWDRDPHWHGDHDRHDHDRH